jgi:hypothetical protein
VHEQQAVEANLGHVQLGASCQAAAPCVTLVVSSAKVRQVLPRQFYLVTRRCTQRQFLLRPDAATNNAFLYCLIAAASRCEIDILLPCALSNHYHAVIYDRAGRYPEFIEHFHNLLARSQNALRGRWENL